jgi:L-threonylcarbamoyladenylate synthase
MAILPVSPEAPETATIARAAALLGQGRLVAFPTETVYGLGANALDPAAINRLYEVKGRPAHNPLIVHVADAAAAQRLVTSWPESARKLTEKWWPGPLTIVLPKARDVPPEVTAGLPTVALRVPAHPVALALLRAAGVPVAAPSANRSGEVSPTTAAHVAASLGDQVPMILDGGPTTVGIESTVVDLSGATPVLLRPGMLTREAIEAVIGPVALARPAADAGSPRPAPGMMERHYAPRAPVVLFGGPAEAEQVTSRVRASGGRIAALVYSARLTGVDSEEKLPGDPSGYARELYGALHRLDEKTPAVILVERPPKGAAWEGIRDRLERAARR